MCVCVYVCVCVRLRVCVRVRVRVVDVRVRCNRGCCDSIYLQLLGYKKTDECCHWSQPEKSAAGE